MTTTDTARPTRADALAAMHNFGAAAHACGVSPSGDTTACFQAEGTLYALIEALTPEPEPEDQSVHVEGKKIAEYEMRLIDEQDAPEPDQQAGAAAKREEETR